MEHLKGVKKSRINKVRNSPEESGLSYKEFGRFDNIMDYSDREISEMIYGIYKAQNMLLVDGDYFLNLNSVKGSCCSLKDVTYIKKPTTQDFRTNAHNKIGNIRTFYIGDYFLLTDTLIEGNTKHRITNYLNRIGILHKGRSKFKGLFSISNDYQTLLRGKYPKDLFHPIKRYINGLFYEDDYLISDFHVETDIRIEQGN